MKTISAVNSFPPTREARRSLLNEVMLRYAIDPSPNKQEEPQRPPKVFAEITTSEKTLVRSEKILKAYPNKAPLANGPVRAVSDTQGSSLGSRVFHFVIQVAASAGDFHLEIKASSASAARRQAQQFPHLTEWRDLTGAELEAVIANERRRDRRKTSLGPSGLPVED